jgi:serine protease Do
MLKLILLPLLLLSTPLIHAQDESLTSKLSSAFVQTVKSCKYGVVSIQAEYGQKNSKNNLNHESFDEFERFQEDFFRHFFKPHGQQGKAQPQTSQGTGFLVTNDGYIMTNYHVIKNATTIKVELYDNTDVSYTASVVGCDPASDIAVLKIEVKNLTHLKFADSDLIEEGQWSIAIGHPFKMRHSVTSGIISATHRAGLQISQIEDFIQTDASINPGNSGGPLLNLDGEVIGMNTAILSKSGGNIGLGFAIPSNLCSMVFEQIKDKGHVDRAFLGVQIQDLTQDLTEGFGLKSNTKGALIADIVKDSPAQKGGIERGDIVLKFNDKAITNARQLQTSVGKLPSGESCRVLVLRDNKQKLLTLTLGSQNQESKSREGDLIHKIGITVEELRQDNAHKFGLKSSEKGLAITSIKPGSIAQKNRWPLGGVILSVARKPVVKVKDLTKILAGMKAGQKGVVTILFKGHTTFSTFTLPK